MSKQRLYWVLFLSLFIIGNIFSIVGGKASNSDNTTKNAVVFPDNIMNVNCVIDPPEQNWTISEPINFDGKAAGAPHGVHSMSTPLVADLDGDGIPEIVVPILNTMNGPWNSNGLLVVNVKYNTERVINTVLYGTHGQSVAIANVDKHLDGNTSAEIFIQGADGKVYCYDGVTGNLKSGFTATANLGAHYIVQLADINNDGTPELVAGPYIFNALTGGTPLVTLTFDPNGTGYGNPHSLGVTQVSGYDGYYFMPVLADMDGDGDLEMVAGNTVYDINLTNNTWSIQRQANASALPYAYLDGPTVVVDFDNDGDLDVAVIGFNGKGSGARNLQFYVWDGQTSEIIGYAPMQASSFASIPYVGDLDKDGFPDFVFATATHGLISYSYDPTVSPGKVKRGNTKPVFAETSGFTMFDFNQDGKSEIVYRGVTSFYIVDGVTLENLTPPSTTYSGTVSEYPIVADVDADGQAEIILTRANIQWTGSDARGVVSVYKSGDPNEKWAPARKVWNQWPYCSVNINEDMTVPQYQFSQAHIFPGKDRQLGTEDDVQPFNGFLTQQTYLSQYGIPFYPVPNAVLNSASFVWDDNGTDMKVTVEVSNDGDVDFVAPFKISLYRDAASSSNVLYTYSYNQPIAKGGNPVLIEFTIPNFDALVGSYNPSTGVKLILRVNDGGDATKDQLTCGDAEDYSLVYPNEIGLFEARNDFALSPLTESVVIPILGNDALGTCTSVTLSVELVPGSGPSLGTAVINGKTLIYTPAGDKTGLDKMDYTITCSGTAVQATVYVYVLPGIARTCPGVYL